MDATDHFDIDGQRPRIVETPSSIDSVVELLAQASVDGSGVAPVGGGGALQIGNPIERYDIALDMREIDRVLEHQAADLVLSVEAGARLSDVSEALARHGQWLPIEAPDPTRATIGGLVATALSGPGRLGHGSLRDYLIGISVVTPTGGLAKAGGMVVKNVSGFDLMRLHHGALGSLGVIVSANFKVLPAPRGQSSMLCRCADLTAAFDTVEIVNRLSQPPSAVVIDQIGAATIVCARFDGLPGQVRSMATAAGEQVDGESEVLVEDESRTWWRVSIDTLARPQDGIVEVRFGSRPASIASLSTTFEGVARSRDISLESLRIWPGLGTLIVRLDAALGSGDFDVVVRAAEEAGATWRILAAPAILKLGRDVWGQPPSSLTTMRRLKDQFDPGRILNPGRFSGHI